MYIHTKKDAIFSPFGLMTPPWNVPAMWRPSLLAWVQHSTEAAHTCSVLSIPWTPLIY